MIIASNKSLNFSHRIGKLVQEEVSPQIPCNKSDIITWKTRVFPFGLRHAMLYADDAYLKWCTKSSYKSNIIYMSINISYLILGMYQAPLEIAFRSNFKEESLVFFMASQFQALQMGRCVTDLSSRVSRESSPYGTGNERLPRDKLWLSYVRQSQPVTLAIWRVKSGLRDRIDLDHLLQWLWWRDDCPFGTDVIGEVGIDQSDEYWSWWTSKCDIPDSILTFHAWTKYPFNDTVMSILPVNKSDL